MNENICNINERPKKAIFVEKKRIAVKISIVFPPDSTAEPRDVRWFRVSALRPLKARNISV